MGMAQGAVEKIRNALDPKAAKTRKTADDFESMFLEQTLDRMFQSVG